MMTLKVSAAKPTIGVAVDKPRNITKSGIAMSASPKPSADRIIEAIKIMPDVISMSEINLKLRIYTAINYVGI